jgi:peroxiredoxin
MKKSIVLMMLMISASMLHAQSVADIRAAISNQMKLYPMSQLRDIYKSCFQDVYGPGHIIADTAHANKYLLSELAQMNGKAESYSKSSSPKDYYEPVGINGNFYRVNLNIILNNGISYDRFFNAFVRSTNGVKPMPVAQWAKKWALIESEVRKMKLNLPNFSSDSAAIARLLQQGKYAFDHSQAYRDAYNPHYRIVSKKIFEKELLPYITLYLKADSNGYIVFEGDEAPDFVVKLTDGRSVRLKDLRGKVVMLQFTASWCGVCRKEMPFIEKDIWQRHKDNTDFVLIGIDRDEPLATVTRFGKEVGITYPLGLDPGADIYAKYALRESGITRNVLIGRDGKIVLRTRLYNPQEFESLVNKIDGLLQNNGTVSK